MNIVYFVLIVTAATFCGAFAGAIIACAATRVKRPKSRTVREVRK